MSTRWPWRIPVTTQGGLLALALSASAENVWMLWHGQTANGRPERWNVYDTYSDFLQCDTEVKRIISEAAARPTMGNLRM